jgi:hypothetical protein
MKQYKLVNVTKATTKDFGFENIPINASSAKGCISFTTWNGFLKLEIHVIVLLLI